MENLAEAPVTAIPLPIFRQLMVQDEYLVLDSRPATTFTTGFIPGSVSIGLEGRFTDWAAQLLPKDKKLLLVTRAGEEKETRNRLLAAGQTNVHGFLEGGFEAWIAAGERSDLIIDIEADEMAMDMPHDDRLVVVDLRSETDFEQGHVDGAINLPLEQLNDVAQIASLPEEANLYLHCVLGYRSVIAASLIKRQGIHNIRNVLGGWQAILEEKRIKTVIAKHPSN
jgi:rhodanese-related sulfurtransferase